MNADFILIGWLGVVLAMAFLGGFLARKAKQPAVVGYLLVGVFISLFTSKLFPAKNLLSFLAEMGVALLMFTLGLELSLDYLRRVKMVAIWGALVQILLIIVLSIFILPLFGFDFYSSLFMGAAFSLSSTAIVVKILSEKGSIDTLPGEIMLGWLLVQDLAVLPMLVILPAIAGNGGGFGLLALNILKVFAVLIGVLLLGRKLVPKFINWVSNFSSRELLLIAVFSLCLLTAIFTSALGLSLAMGAFLAGLIISKSSENHAIFSEIRPLRDVFSIVFFVSLGMFLNPYFLASNILMILLISILIVLFKMIIIMGLVLYLGYHAKTSILVGMGLVQVGEFAFILSRVGLSQNLINENVYSIILSVALLTILITPWFISAAPRFYFFLQKASKRFPRIYEHLFAKVDRFEKEGGLELEDHVVICGYGRVGSWLARALQLLNVPYVVIDYNHRIIMKLKKQGVEALYGDPADIDVLQFAQVRKAKIVVMAIPDQATQEIIIANCQTLNSSIKVISRIHQKEAFSRLKTLGVTCFIQPEFEAALSIIHRVLQFLGVNKEEIPGKIKRIKIEHGMFK